MGTGQGNEQIKDVQLNDEIIIKPESIANQNFYNEIESFIECSICLKIISEPMQCSSCQHIFCKNCIDGWKKSHQECPFRCTNNTYMKSIRTNDLLQKLIIKCDCNQEIKYENYFKHKENECPAIFNDVSNLRKKYDIINKKYKKLEEDNKKNLEEIKKLQEENKKNLEENKNFETKIICKCQILTDKHNHVLYAARRLKNVVWFCDYCRKKFNSETPSFLCSVCDFDLCIDCGRKFVINGNMENINKLLGDNV